MYNAYGLAIINLRASHMQKALDSFRGRSSTSTKSRLRQRILNRFNLQLCEVEPSLVDLHLDMNNSHKLVVMPIDKDREAWFGWSIAAIQDQLLSVWEFDLPHFDAIFLTLDFEHPTFSYQHIEEGRLGPAALTTPKKIWSRVFKTTPIPVFHLKNIIISDIAKWLGTNESLLKDVLLTLRRKGFSGLAYHSELQEWVFAKSLAKDQYAQPDMFQELNLSGKKKGQPIKTCEQASSGLSFISQSSLIHMISQEIILRELGFRVNYYDGIDYDQKFKTRKCLRYKITKIKNDSKR